MNASVSSCSLQVHWATCRPRPLRDPVSSVALAGGLVAVCFYATALAAWRG
jgi:hypothetical protein